MQNCFVRIKINTTAKRPTTKRNKTLGFGGKSRVLHKHLVNAEMTTNKITYQYVFGRNVYQK